MEPNIDKSLLEKIKKNLQYTSNSNEYKVREKFIELGYKSDPIYYRDYDKKKDSAVNRELDFFSFKLAKKFVSYKALFLKHTEEISYNLIFIGDVKYIKDASKDLYFIGLLDQELGKLEDQQNFSFIVMNQTNIFDGNFMKGTRKLEKINLPLCHQLLLYNYDGTQYQEKNSKYSIFNMGEQVISGYRAYKHKRTIIPVYDYSIIFPMIIFGNKINFMSGYPSEILNDNIKRSEGLLYRFISPAISSDLSTSIIITDIQKMEGIIRSVENFVEKFFEFELLDMKDIPTTLNVH